MGSTWRVDNELTPGLVEEMARLDLEHSVRGAGGKAFLSNPGNKEFLLDLCDELSDRGWLWLHSLRIEGVLRSFVLSFIYDRRFLSYQCAFDQEYSKYGIGVINMMKTIAYALDMNMNEFDFLSGDELYKLEWTNQVRQNRRLYVFNKGATGLVLYASHKCVQRMRELLKKDH